MKNSLGCTNRSTIRFIKTILTITFAACFTIVKANPRSSLDATEKYLVKNLFNELQNYTRHLLINDEYTNRYLLPRTLGYKGLLKNYNRPQCSSQKEMCPKHFRDSETIKIALSDQNMLYQMIRIHQSDSQKREEVLDYFMSVLFGRNGTYLNSSMEAFFDGYYHKKNMRKMEKYAKKLSDNLYDNIVSSAFEDRYRYGIPIREIRKMESAFKAFTEKEDFEHVFQSYEWQNLLGEDVKVEAFKTMIKAKELFMSVFLERVVKTYYTNRILPVDQLDSNRDGLLDRDEFERYVQQIQMIILLKSLLAYYVVFVTMWIMVYFYLCKIGCKPGKCC